MGYGFQQESAGKIVFVNLYSARTRGYKPTTRQEQNISLPHRGLEPSLLFAILLLFQFIALQSFASSLFGFLCSSAVPLYVSSCFPFLSAFLLSQSKKKIILVICCFTLPPFTSAFNFLFAIPHSYFRQNVTNRHSRL
jgi:hypothetical protein